MDKEEIIHMAREAGFNVEQGVLLRVTGIDEDLERFAALVAAAARAEENEACAKVCEELRDEDGYEAWNTECAAAIRARSMQ